jgi:hypothetical protein
MNPYLKNPSTGPFAWLSKKISILWTIYLIRSDGGKRRRMAKKGCCKSHRCYLKIDYLVIIHP